MSQSFVQKLHLCLDQLPAPLSTLLDLHSNILDLGLAPQNGSAQDLHLLLQIKGLADQAILCLLIFGEVLGSGHLGFSGSVLQPQSTLLLMVQQLAGQLGLPPQSVGQIVHLLLEGFDRSIAHCQQ